MGRTADPNRRELILEAARRIFKEEGYDRSRVSKIAEAAGVSNGTVYLYFKSKQDILEALVNRYKEMMADALLPALENPDTAQAWRNTVHAAFELAKRERDLVVLMDLLYGLSRKIDTMANPRALKELRHFIRDRIALGDIRSYPPEMTAVLVGGLVQFVTKICLVWKDIDILLFEDITVGFIQHALLISFKDDPAGYSCPNQISQINRLSMQGEAKGLI
jgi:AcrR family transcriptional regulator